MPTPDRLAEQLARCVDCFRDANSKEAQKLEFRALMTLLRAEPLTLRDDGGRVSVNGSPVDGSVVASLAQRLALHGIAEITVPQAPLPAEVFELVKALAGQPGSADLPAKLQVAGTGRVSVTLAAVAPPARPAPPSTPSVAPGPPRRASGLGTEGILRGEPMTDIASPDVQVPGASSVTHDPLPPSSESSGIRRGLKDVGWMPWFGR